MPSNLSGNSESSEAPSEAGSHDGISKEHFIQQTNKMLITARIWQTFMSISWFAAAKRQRRTNNGVGGTYLLQLNLRSRCGARPRQPESGEKHSLPSNRQLSKGFLYQLNQIVNNSPFSRIPPTPKYPPFDYGYTDKSNLKVGWQRL